jgi:hypothetical protein
MPDDRNTPHGSSQQSLHTPVRAVQLHHGRVPPFAFEAASRMSRALVGLPRKEGEREMMTAQMTLRILAVSGS